MRGDNFLHLGRREDARRELERAYFEAARAGALEVAQHAAVFLVLGNVHEPERAERWAGHAEVIFALLGAADDEVMRIVLANNLGVMLLRNGEHARAREQLEAALLEIERVLGAEHPSYARNVLHLGEIALEQGRFEQAEGYLRQTIALHRAGPAGEDHPALIGAQVSLGVVLAARGQFEAGKAEVEDAIAKERRLFGPNNPRLVHSIGALGRVYELGGYPERAAELYAQEERLRAEHGLRSRTSE